MHFSKLSRSYLSYNYNIIAIRRALYKKAIKGEGSIDVSGGSKKNINSFIPYSKYKNS